MSLYTVLGYAWFVAKCAAGDEVARVQVFDYARLYLMRRLSSIYGRITARKIPEVNVPIRIYSPDEATTVDRYWSEHTVNSTAFWTRWESQKYFEWLVRDYPLVDEFMDFFDDRTGQAVLDYGCGPGNDIFRFLVVNSARKVIGVDVSLKALELARRRLSLYRINPERLELIQCSDSVDSLPVESESIDHVNCAGVLHHMTNPGRILSEFYRILKYGSSGNVMVYNRDSVFFHLHIAYERMIIENRFNGMSVEDAFARSTDGEECPISRCYNAEEFAAICRKAGFEVDYVGGYFNRSELHWLRKLGKKALQDERLSLEHREFIRKLEYDERGHPKFEGKHAGVGGVYKIYKR